MIDEDEEQKRLQQLAELMRDRDGGVKSTRSNSALVGLGTKFTSAEIFIWLSDHEMVTSRDEAQKLCWQLYELGRRERAREKRGGR
jgi:hypothetical protein